MNDVDAHFVGKSAVVREIYDKIVVESRSCGPLVEDPKKTSIHLNRRYAFAGIQTRRDSLILTVKSTDSIDSGRILRREQASAKRWYHYLKLTSPDEVDDELIDWLRVSYSISG